MLKQINKKSFSWILLIMFTFNLANAQTIDISSKNLEKRRLFRTYGPIKKNEKLWDIAEIIKPSKTITTNQVVVAIYYKNMQAFSKPNINYLKKKSILVIPDIREIRQYSDKKAKKKILKDYRAWKRDLQRAKIKRIKKAFEIKEKGMTKESFMRKDGSIFIQARNKKKKVVRTIEISYKDFIDAHIRYKEINKRIPLFVNKEKKALFVLDNQKKLNKKLEKEILNQIAKNDMKSASIKILNKELFLEKSEKEKFAKKYKKIMQNEKLLNEKNNLLIKKIDQMKQLERIKEKEKQIIEESKFENIWGKIMSNPIYILLLFITQLLISSVMINWIYRRNEKIKANSNLIKINKELKNDIIKAKNKYNQSEDNFTAEQDETKNKESEKETSS